MIKTLQQNFYEFAIKEENFEPMLQMVEAFPKVRLQLIEEFWRLVYEKVKKEEPNLNGWKAWKDPDVSTGSAKTCLYREDLFYKNIHTSNLLTTFEPMDGKTIVGCWFHRHDPQMNGKVDEARKMASEKFSQLGYYIGSGAQWFICYKYAGEDFSQNHSLQNILPQNREMLASEYANLLINTHNELIKLIEDFAVKGKIEP